MVRPEPINANVGVEDPPQPQNEQEVREQRPIKQPSESEYSAENADERGRSADHDRDHGHVSEGQPRVFQETEEHLTDEPNPFR